MAFATSSPELSVGVNSALEGAPKMSLGDAASTVPVFSLAHGDAEGNVPAGQSQQLKDALDEAAQPRR